MFYLTGLPGWIRFGYSPGWGGIPPGAQYLSQTSQLPQAMSWFQQQASAQAPIGPQTTQSQPAPQSAYSPFPPAPQSIQPPQISREQEIQMLEDQAQALEQQIELIRDRLEQLKR